MQNIIRKLVASIKRFYRHDEGAVAVEFAFLLPVFTSLFLMFFETSYFILLNLKTQHAAVSVGDLVTRDETISESGITDLFLIVDHILTPWGTGDQSRVIVSAVSDVADIPTVLWQRRGAGTLVTTSAIGLEGGDATMPTSFVVRADETVIITEFYYTYEPLVIPIFGSVTLNKTTYHRPRLSMLQAVEAD